MQEKASTEMIEFKNGICKCNGTGGILLMELAIVTKHIRDNIARITDGEFAEEELAKMFERSKLPIEEIIELYKADEASAPNSFDELKDLLKSLLES